MKKIYILLLFLIPSISNAYTVLNGAKWGSPEPGTGARVTYSYMPDNTPCDNTNSCLSLFSFMPAGFTSEIDRAFDAWASVANLTFIQVSDDGKDPVTTQNSGDIRLGGHKIINNGSNILAYAYYPYQNTGSSAGDIHFDSSDTWSIGGNGGFDIFFVALHEIGHALGLGHETEKLAIMNATYNPSLGELQPDDIAGIQYLYGSSIVSPVPVPAAIWLFFTAITGLFIARKVTA